jgi:hypothetical protein
MQTISKCELGIKRNPIDIIFSDDEISDDVRIIDFWEKTETGETVITLYSTFFMKGSVRLEVTNRKLKIIVSELVDVQRNPWMPVNDWEQYTHHSYTRIHNMRIMLPEDNFSILQQLIIPGKSYLKVILAKSIAA